MLIINIELFIFGYRCYALAGIRAGAVLFIILTLKLIDVDNISNETM